MDAQRAIARRTVIGLPPDGLSPAWERDFAAYPPAGVIVFARDFADPEALRALTRRLRELAAPRRIFVAIDEEGGWVSQLAGHFVVPPNAALLGVILYLLNEAVRNGARSRMSARTAAICIAPSILTTPLTTLAAPTTPRKGGQSPQQTEQHAAAFGLQKAARVVVCTVL